MADAVIFDLFGTNVIGVPVAGTVRVSFRSFGGDVYTDLTGQQTQLDADAFFKLPSAGAAPPVPTAPYRPTVTMRPSSNGTEVRFAE